MHFIRFKVRVRIRVKYTIPSRTLGLEKVSQNNLSRASTLLLLQISDLEQPRYWVWARFKVKVEIWVRV